MLGGKFWSKAQSKDKVAIICVIILFLVCIASFFQTAILTSKLLAVLSIISVMITFLFGMLKTEAGKSKTNKISVTTLIIFLGIFLGIIIISKSIGDNNLNIMSNQFTVLGLGVSLIFNIYDDISKIK